MHMAIVEQVSVQLTFPCQTRIELALLSFCFWILQLGNHMCLPLLLILFHLYWIHSSCNGAQVFHVQMYENSAEPLLVVQGYYLCSHRCLHTLWIMLHLFVCLLVQQELQWRKILMGERAQTRNDDFVVQSQCVCKHQCLPLLLITFQFFVCVLAQ